MVSKNGVFYMKTVHERELEQRVKDRKRELLESYRAQKEERKEAAASAHFPKPETLRSLEDTTDSVAVSQRSNGLHSAPAPQQQSPLEPHNDRRAISTPSFRLNTGQYHLCTQCCSKSR